MGDSHTKNLPVILALKFSDQLIESHLRISIIKWWILESGHFITRTASNVISCVWLPTLQTELLIKL